MASSRIQGITVEIGGDTTKLQTALKGVNSEIRSTQSQLRDVEKLLKLDPGNTELLTQKHRLLGEAVAETKEKLAALKTAAEQANTALANGEISQSKYDALQREIIETENKLKSLEKQADNSSVALAKLGVLGDKLKNIGGNISAAGEKLMPVSAAVAGLGTVSVSTASKFEASMSQVQATMGITRDSMSEVNGQSVKTMDALSELAKQMGKESAFSAIECAEALNYLALAGYDTQQMCDTLPIVLNLAAAGSIDLAAASDMVTDAMSALGMESSDAKVMVDQMAKTASSANTSVSQLGDGILTIGATAKSVKGGTAELSTALGILANNGIKGSEGGTHLRNILLSLQNPTDKASALMKDLGLQVYDSDGNMRSLNSVLGDLNTSMEGLTSAEKNNIIATIFNKTDLASVNALLANTGESWDNLQQSITDSGGAAAQMAKTQLDNLNGQLTLLKSALESLAISFGELLLPAIKGIVEHIQAFVDKLNGMDEGTKKTIVNIGLFIAAAAPVITVIGKIVSAVGTVISVISKIGPVIGVVKTAVTGLFAALSAANPVVLIAAAVAAVIALFVLLWNKCDAFREFWINLWENIKSAAETVWNGLTDFFSSVWQGIVTLAGTVWSGLTDFFSGLWEGIKSSASAAWEGISGFLSTVWQGIISLSQTIWNGLSEFFSGIWESVKNVFSSALEAVKTVVTAAWDAISGATRTAMNAIKDFIQTAWENIKNVLSAAFNAIKEVCYTAWNAVKDVISTALNAIKETAVNVWNSIKDGISAALENIKAAVSAAWNGIKDAVSSIVTAIKDVVTSLWNGIKESVSSIVNAIKDTISQVWNSIKETVTTIVTAIGDAVFGVFSKLADGVSQTMSNIFDAVKDGFSFIKDHIMNLAKEAIGWGKDLIAGIANGIKSAAGQVKDAVCGVAETIKSHLHFSVPDEGPLTEYESWMPDFMKGLAEGIQKSRSAVKSAISDVAADLSLSPASIGVDMTVLKGGFSYGEVSHENGSTAVADKLDAMSRLMEKYLPQLSRKQIVLDSGTLVGELSDGINRNLGRSYR